MRTDDSYKGYSYAYPHKTAYRSFAAPLRLSDIWVAEPKDSLFLYLHVPFCERRCGYCNLFSLASPGDELMNRYVDALSRHADAVAGVLGKYSVARMALGGGTPSMLSTGQLEDVLKIMARFSGSGRAQVPFSMEISPGTIDDAKFSLMRGSGVSRVSIGVQSFIGFETDTLGRHQSAEQVERAILLAKEHRFQAVNLDLIYGIPEQTADTWLNSLRKAIRFAPEELYLYPLYVRNGTRLAMSELRWPELRLQLYRLARDFLLANGYRQASMRMFELDRPVPSGAPDYCCQEDGMIGLGPGARSYTRTTHYSHQYAVSADEVGRIVRSYVNSADFTLATHGMVLDSDEQRRRYIIKSLLRRAGVDRASYVARFGSDPVSDFPLLNTFRENGWLEVSGGRLGLTDTGLELSDTVGPLLYSRRVQSLMEDAVPQ